MSPPLVNVKGTQLVAGDTREKHREKLARITLDSMVQFVGLLDPEGTVLEINQVALDAVGISLAEVEGKPFWATFWWQVSPEINAELREMIRRAAAGEFVRWDTEIYGRAGGAKTIIIDASLMPVKDEKGKVAFITAEGRDISEKKAHEREIAALRREAEQARRLYETILSTTPDLVYVFNLDHRFIYANKALLTMWGRTWEDAIGKNCLELGYPDWHAAMHDREIEQVIATKKPIRGEVPFTGTNGRRIYDYIFVPVMGPSGDVEGIAGTTRDVTERKQAEDALRESEQRLRAFVSATASVAYRMNADWSEMRQLQGQDFVADTDRPDREWMNKYIHPEDQPQVKAAIEQAIRGGGVFELEHRVLRVDGSLGWTTSRAVPLKGDDGEILEWFGVAVDVTERKHAEEALRRSEKLAATGRLAATMAHEINNPLEAVTNLIYLAKGTHKHEDAHRYLTAAEDELDRISHLTKQTLGFYRETKGASMMRFGAIVSALLSVFSTRLRTRRIAAIADMKDDPEFYGVPGEIRQLVANLVSNSIDAVEDGGQVRIRVASSREWSSGAVGGVRLTVADNGAGIPPGVRHRIFEPFVTTKKDVGTGLGLWVCKSIVERHGGRIHLRSSNAPGNSWTVFSIFLPDNTQPRTE